MGPLRILSAAILLAALATVANAQARAKWQLQEIATIEGVSADEPFGAIRSVALHADGRVVVVDESAHRVSMFDANGRSLGFVGRVGGGPAEFRDPYSAVWIADTLAVYDPGESRIAFLTNGKTPLRIQQTARLTGGHTVRFYPVSRNKAYLLQVRRAGTRSERVFVPIGGGGAPDTVVLPPSPQLSSGTMCKIDGGIRFFTWPEAPVEIVLPVRRDGSIVHGHTGAYQLKVQSPAAAPVATIARTDVTFLEFPESMFDAELETYRKHVAEYGAAGCQSKPVKPPHRAPLKAVAVADNGDIWVSAYGKNDYTHDVFTPDGKLRGSIPIKGIVANHIPLAITGDRVALVEQDRDGVQTVKLFRIVR